MYSLKQVHTLSYTLSSDLPKQWLSLPWLNTRASSWVLRVLRVREPKGPWSYSQVSNREVIEFQTLHTLFLFFLQPCRRLFVSCRGGRGRQRDAGSFLDWGWSKVVLPLQGRLVRLTLSLLALWRVVFPLLCLSRASFDVVASAISTSHPTSLCQGLWWCALQTYPALLLSDSVPPPCKLHPQALTPATLLSKRIGLHLDQQCPPITQPEVGHTANCLVTGSSLDPPTVFGEGDWQCLCTALGSWFKGGSL